MKSKLINLLVAAMALVITLSAGYGFGFLATPTVEDVYRPYYTEGIDFRFQSEQSDLAKYKIGLRFDASKLNLESSGQPLIQTGDGLTLLFVTNPGCPYAGQARDISTRLKSTIEKNGLGIRYIPAIFSRMKPGTDTKKYLGTIAFDDYAVWGPPEEVPELLSGMPTPGFLLIDQSGVILRTWFPSSSLEPVRARMSEQMIRELTIIKETVQYNDAIK